MLRLDPDTVRIDADEAEGLAEAALAHGDRVELAVALDAFTRRTSPRGPVRTVVPGPPGTTGRTAGEDPPRTGRRSSCGRRHRGSGGDGRAGPRGLARRGVRAPHPDGGVHPAGAPTPGRAPVPPVPGGTGRGDRRAAGPRDGSAAPQSPRRADHGRPVAAARAAGSSAGATLFAPARPGRRAGRAAEEPTPRLSSSSPGRPGWARRASLPRRLAGPPRRARSCCGAPATTRKGNGRTARSQRHSRAGWRTAPSRSGPVRVRSIRDRPLSCRGGWSRSRGEARRRSGTACSGHRPRCSANWRSSGRC